MTLPTPQKPGRRPDRPAATRPLVLGNLSLAVGRAMGTVVVTVKGTVGEEGRQLLEGVLTDLIEGQGNLKVAVDLGKATVDPAAVILLGAAAARARGRGGRFIVKGPPAEIQAALQASGLDRLMEVLPRGEAAS
jgi:anti-anti-sigma regulatory factor